MPLLNPTHDPFVDSDGKDERSDLLLPRSRQGAGAFRSGAVVAERVLVGCPNIARVWDAREDVRGDLMYTRLT
jgi:hypothetical protein